MRIYKQDELKSKIKSGSFAPVYFLFGNEPYLITHYTNLIIKNNVTALEDINLRYYDSEFDADEIYATAFQVPMMSAKKCLVITDCDFSKLSEKQLSVFCDLAENPSDVSIVVFRYTDMEISFKKQYGANSSNKNRDKMLSAIEKGGGMIVEINHMTTGDLVKTITSGARKRHCSIDPQVARHMIERCSDDLTTLLGETEKLCSYLNEGTITKELVDEICTQSVSSVIFDMSKAVLSNNVKAAMKILDDLIFQKVKETEILREIAKNYIDIYRVSAARRAGLNTSDVDAHFGYGRRAFVLNNAVRFANKLSQKQILLSLKEICNADYMLKGGSSMKKKTILEMLLIKLMMISSKGETVC